MVNRIRLFLTFIILLFAFEVSAEAKFKQKISWSEDPNAYEYRVEIETAGGKKIDSVNTTATSYTFSKPAGKYRYRVYALDFLGRESSVSKWQDFEIVKAVQPEIEKIPEKIEAKVLASSGSSASEENPVLEKIEISADVNGVSEESEITLENTATGKTVKSRLVINEDGSKKIVAENTVPGAYRIVIKNPGGLTAESKTDILIEVDNSLEIARQRALEEERLARLEAEERAEQERQRLLAEEAKRLEDEKNRIALEAQAAEEKRLEQLRIAEAEAEKQSPEEELISEKEEKKKRKRLDDYFYLSAGWSMPVEVLDGTLEEYTDKKNYVVSAAAKMQLDMFEAGGFIFGLSINASGFKIANEKNNLELTGYLGTGIACLNVSRQFFNKKFTLGVHGGGGAAAVIGLKYNFVEGDESQTVNTWNAAFGGGLSLKYAITKLIYTDFNVDYVHVRFNDFTLGLVLPSASIGIKL